MRDTAKTNAIKTTFSLTGTVLVCA